MAQKLPRPTDVELQILDVFWERGPSTVRQAHNTIIASPDRKGTSYSTTLKMIQVLHEKGFLTRDASIRPQVYQTTVTREATQRRVVEDMALYFVVTPPATPLEVADVASETPPIALTPPEPRVQPVEPTTGLTPRSPLTNQIDDCIGVGRL